MTLDWNCSIYLISWFQNIATKTVLMSFFKTGAWQSPSQVPSTRLGQSFHQLGDINQMIRYNREIGVLLGTLLENEEWIKIICNICPFIFWTNGLFFGKIKYKMSNLLLEKYTGLQFVHFIFPKEKSSTHQVKVCWWKEQIWILSYYHT